MLDKEITVWGLIKIPYPFLEDFKFYINRNKGKTSYKNYSDFISDPIVSLNNSIALFGYTFRYDNNFENILIIKFEEFLKEIKFLSAVIQISIESKDNYFYEYISDGVSIFKYDYTISETKLQVKI